MRVLQSDLDECLVHYNTGHLHRTLPALGPLPVRAIDLGIRSRNCFVKPPSSNCRNSEKALKYVGYDGK